MEAIIDEEEFLSLSLSLPINSKSVIKSKRKRDEAPDRCSDSSESCYEKENRLLSLLQMRERMLRLDHKNIDYNSTNEDSKGFRLIRLLLMSATSIDKNNVVSAVDSLLELYRSVSFKGDAIQRVSAYFADALVLRLLTPKSPSHELILDAPNPDEEFLAFARLYKVSPFYQFAHFTANQAILEAFERGKSTTDTNNNNSRVLHVIDLDVSYGFQWPSLMQNLSENRGNTNLVFLKITGFGRNREELQETESRLASFAEGYPNLIFEFDGIVRGSKLAAKLKIKKGETVAVNLISLLDSLHIFSDMSSDTLQFIYSLSPSIVTLVEQEEVRKNTHSFLALFAESLHHFAAAFDSLDECLPLDSVERLSIEKSHLGRQIKHVMNHYYRYGDDDCCDNDEKMRSSSSSTSFKRRMESHGFSGLEVSSASLAQAKLVLRMRSSCCSCLSFDNGNVNGGFRVVERDDGKAVSLAWRERTLVTVSSWCCM